MVLHYHGQHHGYFDGESDGNCYLDSFHQRDYHPIRDCHFERHGFHHRDTKRHLYRRIYLHLPADG